MKSRIGFLGLGQCGGNIAQLFEKEGYKCLVVNTSEEDLDTVNVKFKYKIPESDGCSHDRDKAILLVKKYYKEIIDEIKDKLQDKDIIYMVFGAGGGTGSGSAIILFDLLYNQLNSNIGTVVALPSIEEDIQVQINAHQSYKSLTEKKNIKTIFTLDNNVTDKLLINQTFVSLFNNMIDIPNHKGQKGNIDKSELLKILSQRGNIIISLCNNSPEEDILKALFRSWENNIFAPIEKDKKIYYLGLSVQEDIDLESIKDYIGKPYDSFINYNDEYTISVLSGLSFPEKRIKVIADLINKNKEHITGIMKHNQNNKIESNIDWISEIKGLTTESKEIVDLTDILSKY